MRLERILQFFSLVLFFIFFIGLSWLSLKLFVWDTVYEERTNNGREYALNDPSHVSIEEVELNDVIKNNKPLKSRPFSVLLLGVDTSDLTGRSDTMMVALVNPGKSDVSLLSIPRDTRAKIHGRDFEKIGHAHSYGLETAIYTVEDLLQIPIDYSVSINLNGFTDLIDAIGGLKIDVEKDISFRDRLSKQTVSLKAGKQLLPGKEVLHYARYRSDSEGDFGRVRRQQQVISEIINQTTDLRNLSNLTNILTAIGTNIKTDITMNQMIKMVTQLSDINGDNVSKVPLKATTSMINGLSYVIISDTEIQNLRSEMKRKLTDVNK